MQYRKELLPTAKIQASFLVFTTVFVNLQKDDYCTLPSQTVKICLNFEQDFGRDSTLPPSLRSIAAITLKSLGII